MVGLAFRSWQPVLQRGSKVAASRLAASIHLLLTMKGESRVSDSPSPAYACGPHSAPSAAISHLLARFEGTSHCGPAFLSEACGASQRSRCWYRGVSFHGGVWRPALRELFSVCDSIPWPACQRLRFFRGRRSSVKFLYPYDSARWGRVSLSCHVFPSWPQGPAYSNTWSRAAHNT